MTDKEKTKAGMALLAEWMAATPRAFLPATARDNPNAIYKNTTARAAAISLVEDGVTPADIAAFVQDWLAEGEERDHGIALLYFQIVANEILAWKWRRDNPPRPRDDPDAPPSFYNSYYEPDEAALDHWEKMQNGYYKRPDIRAERDKQADMWAEARARLAKSRQAEDDAARNVVRRRKQASGDNARRELDAAIYEQQEVLKGRALSLGPVSPEQLAASTAFANGQPSPTMCTCTAVGPSPDCPRHSQRG